MKKRLTIGLSLVLALTLAGCAASTDAAIVNGESISMEELELEVLAFEESIASSGLSLGASEDEEYQKILREEVLNIMIREKVLRQELVKQNIEISDAGAIEYLDSMRAVYGAEQFDQILIDNGLDEETFIDDFAFNEAVGTLLEQLTVDLVVEEQEVRDYYDANTEAFIQGKASHILVQFNVAEASEELIEEKKQRAQDILDRLANGEDFALVATEMSDDGSAANGGQLDALFTLYDSPYVDEFTVAALALEEGEYTLEPVESQFGYHIIKLDEKTEDYELHRESIQQQLLKNKQDAFFSDYIVTLVEQAEIENFVKVEQEDDEVE